MNRICRKYYFLRNVCSNTTFLIRTFTFAYMHRKISNNKFINVKLFMNNLICLIRLNIALSTPLIDYTSILQGSINVSIDESLTESLDTLLSPRAAKIFTRLQYTGQPSCICLSYIFYIYKYTYVYIFSIYIYSCMFKY